MRERNSRLREHIKSAKGKRRKTCGWYQEAKQKSQNKKSQEKSYKQMMDDRFEEFEERLTHNLTEKPCKSDKFDC